MSKVFGNGSASDEIERRTKARLKKGDAADRVESGVVDELASELIEGRGLGLVLRPHDDLAPAPAVVAAGRIASE